MKDKEIIKALEICISGDCDLCSCKCESVGDCRDALNKKSLDLINRQKEEIERLKDILYDADGVNLVNYWHQQCKIAENGCRNFEEENETLKAEIERIHRHTEMYHEVRAEAVKEFAKRLKFEKATGMNWFGKEHYSVKVEEIDNLVKEMVGENK